MAKNNVQSVSYLLYTQVDDPAQLTRFENYHMILFSFLVFFFLLLFEIIVIISVSSILMIILRYIVIIIIVSIYLCDKVETSLERHEHFFQFQDTTDALPCHVHLPACLWIMDPQSRPTKRNISHGNEVLPQDTTHLIQRPFYQRGSPCQDPAGNTDHTKTPWTS